MWGDKKALPGEQGRDCRQRSLGNSWEGCVLMILLRSGDALETAEALREG